jgi:hypothetical protein
VEAATVQEPELQELQVAAAAEVCKCRKRAVTGAAAAAATAAKAGAAAIAEVGDRIHANDLNRSHHMDRIGRDFYIAKSTLDRLKSI